MQEYTKLAIHLAVAPFIGLFFLTVAFASLLLEIPLFLLSKDKDVDL